MRSLRRRKQNIWICKVSIDDSHMEPVTKYSKPEKHRVSVSNTSGTPHELPVGLVSEYTRYFVSFDRDFHPEEGMVLFVDREPELDDNGELILGENGEPNVKPDYVLTHIMDTARGTIARYGIKKIAGDEESAPESDGDDDEQDNTNEPVDNIGEEDNP